MPAKMVGQAGTLAQSVLGMFASSTGRRIAGGALIIALAGILSTTGAFYLVASKTIARMATDDLTHVVDATLNMMHQAAGQAVINHLRAKASTNRAVVAELYAEFRAGRITEAEAKSLAEKVLLSQHIGTSGYIYCLDSKGVIRVHPKRALLGVSLTQYAFIRDQLRRQEGYLEYSWKNPGEAMPRPKALYMTYFQPWDWIISVSSYRDEFDGLIQAKDFRDDILSIKIGKTGYLYILDKNGTLIVHPTSEGQNYAEVRDVKGKHFVREMLRNKNGQIIYWWKNPGEQNAREKIVVYKYYPSFKWVIGGGAYLDEINRPMLEIRKLVAAILVGTCLLALFLSLWFGRGVITAQNLSEMMLRSSLETTERIIDRLPFALVLTDVRGRVLRANTAAGTLCRIRPDALADQVWETIHPAQTAATPELRESQIVDCEGKTIPVLLATIPMDMGQEKASIVAFVDLRERRALEQELYQSQKLEAVGRLAAGIAHEINTPTQYVGDNAKFLETSFKELLELVRTYQDALAWLSPGPEQSRIQNALQAAEEKADLAYLRENVPAAFASTQDGITRIVSIVQAMKEFAHPEIREKNFADINRALQATLTIARNEYKYVAEVETEFGDIPLVNCLISDINQVFLNLLVNASQAIAEKSAQTQTKGLIRVRTRLDGKWVRVEIEDTGAGIPEKIRHRIFEPFFTTKEVGKGTGQGLAIARSIIVEKHGGSLTFTSETGLGSTFVILLPADPAQPEAEPAGVPEAAVKTG